IGADVRGARIEMRWLDLGNNTPGRHPSDVTGDVIPGLSAVERVPDLAIVGARPDEAFLNFRRRNRKDHLAVELAQVIAHDPARRNNSAGVFGGKIGAELAPAHATIAGLENELAAVVDRVVVEGIDGQR